MTIAGSLNYDTKIDTSGFQKGINKMTSSATSGGAKIRNIVAGLGITKIISSAISTINNSIDDAISRIDTMNNYPKVMANLGIESEKAEESIKKLSDKLTGLPTTLDSAALSVQRLTSANGDIEKSTDMFLAMNNAILAGGASTEIQTSALEQLSQAYAKGKPDMMEWRTIMTAMPAQLKQVAISMGYISTEELGEALREGNLSMDAFMDEIVKLNKVGTKKFLSFEKQAKNATGGINTSITNMKTAITRGVAKVVESIDKSLKKANLGSLSDQISNLGKVAEKTFKEVANVIEKINWQKVIEAIKTLIPIVTSLVAVFISYQATLKAIELINVAKSIASTTVAFIDLIPSITSAKDALTLLNMAMNANPVGLVVAGITALVATLTLVTKAVSDAFNEKHENAINNMAQGIGNFNNAIQSGETYLSKFNTSFESLNKKNEKISSEMNDIQSKITQIVENATSQRRKLTQDEIDRIDEYLKKIRTLEEQELEIQRTKSEAIIKQAQVVAQNSELSLQEYIANGEKWLATAQQQANAQLEIIEQQRINEIAILNQKYGEKATLDNKEYARELEAINDKKDANINAVNKEIGDIYNIYAQGLENRLNLQEKFNKAEIDGFWGSRETIKTEAKRHEENMKSIKEDGRLSEKEKNLLIEEENERHNKTMSELYKEAIVDLSEEEQEALGVYLTMVGNTELYGGKINTKTKNNVNKIIKAWDSLPKESKNTMKDTLSPMLSEMEEKTPVLYSRATSIATGILSRLKKAFDIHSPSRKTKAIFQNVMKGMEIGIDDEKNKLYKQVDNLSEDILSKMREAVNIETGKMSFGGTTGSVSQILSANSVIKVENYNTLELDGEKVYENQQTIQKNKNLQYGFGGAKIK